MMDHFNLGRRWSRRAAVVTMALVASAALAMLPGELIAPLRSALQKTLAPGQAVLDLASGIGEPALDIARRVGETGVVTATDMVPEMLVGARRRAAEANLANIRFEIVDMEALPFATASFDVVSCRLGVMFATDRAAALLRAASSAIGVGPTVTRPQATGRHD